jgi:hypothetical protein
MFLKVSQVPIVKADVPSKSGILSFFNRASLSGLYLEVSESLAKRSVSHNLQELTKQIAEKA